MPGCAPRDERDGGDIYAPAGTKVRLRIHTDKAIAQGEIALGGASTVPVRAVDSRTVEADLVLARNDSYRVRLSDADGLRSSGDTEYFIRLMDDRPPDVRILRPSADQQITPLEEIAIEARADDDYGIADFDLVYAVGGGAERVVPFDRVSGTSVQKVGMRLLPAEDLGVKPGDVITYYARARDIGRGKRSTRATSDIFFLEVTPFNEEFVAAQSQASAGSAAEAQIESLIQAQKEIIASTWNVERRSQAGRSAEDVKAIAQAQAELRDRAQAMGSRSGRGGRPPAPAPVPQRAAAPEAQRFRQSEADPIAAAVAAMVKAEQQLATERTKEALPHEMAALNGLLQAQAEVRRRQVSQQANGAGSGGSNRSGQDLSALFDKELQRQQRTNYETQSAVETRPDQRAGSDSALDRIRDLARRQEDLSRRQRELAQAGLSAEEVKRQLEKLTREQTELREQAEELARRMGQQNQPQRGQQGQRGESASGQPPKDGGPPGQGSGDLRDASEQMRTAAGELRRDDPAAAAQSGQRAAEKLRRLEERMRGDAPGANQRAGSDVQLEAQQIAQEQRRIAAEAERLDKSAGASAAAARSRLADEKDRLAGRVEELQRSAQQIARGKLTPEEAGAMNDAARALERERIAQRMRETAKGMRNPAGAGADGTAPGKRISRARSSAWPTGSISPPRPGPGRLPISWIRLARSAIDCSGSSSRCARPKGARAVRVQETAPSSPPNRAAVRRRRNRPAPARTAAADRAADRPAASCSGCRRNTSASSSAPATRWLAWARASSRTAQTDPRRNSTSSADRRRGPKRSSRIAPAGSRSGRISTWRSRNTKPPCRTGWRKRAPRIASAPEAASGSRIVTGGASRSTSSPSQRRRSSGRQS